MNTHTHTTQVSCICRDCVIVTNDMWQMALYIVAPREVEAVQASRSKTCRSTRRHSGSFSASSSKGQRHGVRGLRISDLSRLVHGYCHLDPRGAPGRVAAKRCSPARMCVCVYIYTYTRYIYIYICIYVGIAIALRSAFEARAGLFSKSLTRKCMPCGSSLATASPGQM